MSYGVLTRPIAVLAFFGWPEALLIVGVAFVIFGRRIPDAARGLGRSIVEFRRALAGGRGDVAPPADDRPRPERDGRET